MKRVLKDELGENWEEYIENIESMPLGAASLAQVHKGYLKINQEPIAIKI